MNTLYTLIAGLLIGVPCLANEEGQGAAAAAYGAAEIIKSASPMAIAAAKAGEDVATTSAKAAGALGKMQAEAGAEMYKSQMNVAIQKDNLQTSKELAEINWKNALLRDQMEREERLNKFYADLRMSRYKERLNQNNRFMSLMLNYRQRVAQMDTESLQMRLGFLSMMTQNGSNMLSGGVPFPSPISPLIGLNQSQVPQGAQPGMMGLARGALPADRLMGNAIAQRGLRSVSIPRTKQATTVANTFRAGEANLTRVASVQGIPHRAAVPVAVQRGAGRGLSSHGSLTED